MIFWVKCTCGCDWTVINKGGENMQMSEEAKELKRAYEREWRKKNPEKCRAIKTRYWEKKLAKMKEENESEGK